MSSEAQRKAIEKNDKNQNTIEHQTQAYHYVIRPNKIRVLLLAMKIIFMSPVIDKGSPMLAEEAER